MEQAKILVVEDEPIVARDIQTSLQRLGYDVPMTAVSGEEAIRKAGTVRPDLVIMDVVLKGKMDGIEAAKQIRQRFDLPVIYLTAYGDEQTLQRAKTSSPAGYMLKPYEPNELRSTIEVALQRSQNDRHVRDSLRWLATTIRCMGEAVIMTNQAGRLTYMSPAAEALTGWTYREASGIGLTAMLCGDDQTQGWATENPALRVMAEGRIIQLDHLAVLTKDNMRRSVSGSAAPVIDDTGVILGVVVVLRDRGTPSIVKQAHSWIGHEVHEAECHLARASGVINLCAWCKRVPDESGEWYDLETFIAEHSAMQFNGGLCPDCLQSSFESRS